MKVDLDAVRREAAGPGHEPVAVTRRLLSALLDLIDGRPSLDIRPDGPNGMRASMVGDDTGYIPGYRVS